MKDVNRLHGRPPIRTRRSSIAMTSRELKHLISGLGNYRARSAALDLYRAGISLFSTQHILDLIKKHPKDKVGLAVTSATGIRTEIVL